MNSSTLTLTANTDALCTAKSTKPVTAAQVVRCIARKWDLIAVIGLMASSAAVSILALVHVG